MTSPKQNEFFKFYICYMIVGAIISAVPMLLWGFTDHDPAVNSPLTIGLNVVGSLISLGTFVLSIVALVLFVKRKYPKITWLLPISYFILVGAAIIFSMVFSLLTLGQQFDQLGVNPDPAELQAMTESLNNDIPVPFVIITIAQSIILITLAVVTWFKTPNINSSKIAK